MTARYDHLLEQLLEHVERAAAERVGRTDLDRLPEDVRLQVVRLAHDLPAAFLRRALDEISGDPDRERACARTRVLLRLFGP